MRTHLKGVGGPIPLVALPDPNVDTNFPPQTFLYEEDGVFDKTDYESLGYTHFEVWCIGGAGGRGGGKGGGDVYSVGWSQSQTRPRMSGSDWELYIELMTIYASQLDPPYGPYYPSNPDGVRAYYESQFPNHDPYYVTTYTNPYLLDQGAKGGAGGGGGLHVVSGALTDLAEETPVIVGEPGVDAALGHSFSNGPWTPIPYQIAEKWPTTETRLKELSNYFNDYMNKHPTPHVVFQPPVVGGDGGVSSFGAVAKASGGKGGGPAITWPGGVLTHTGLGGDGGAGNQEVAGGGAAGSAVSTSPGADGTWDGVVGKGGGGGIGGSTSPARTASHGGRGSYSFADPSVHGPRQTRSGVIPGGGGGATIESLASHYGSKAINAKPGGVVFVRLIKVN